MSKSNDRVRVAGNLIEGNVFIGSHYDAKTIDAIGKIADGLMENAKAFHTLASCLDGSETNVGSMLNISGPNN